MFSSRNLFEILGICRRGQQWQSFRHHWKSNNGDYTMFKLLKTFRDSEDGAAMVEYAIALLVAAGIGVATFSVMGTAAATNATAACTALTGTGSNTAGSC